MAAAPPIPIALAHRPTSAGLVVPYISPQRSDGAHVLGVVDAARQAECLTLRLCQICGRSLGQPMVFALRESDLMVLLPGMVYAHAAEAAMHPVCAAYSFRQCPMLAGRMSHYRSTPHPINVDADRPLWQHAPDTPARLGKPAEPWVEVWMDSYTVETGRGGSGLCALLSGPARRIRPLAEHPSRRAPVAPPDEAGRPAG